MAEITKYIVKVRVHEREARSRRDAVKFPLWISFSTELFHLVSGCVCVRVRVCVCACACVCVYACVRPAPERVLSVVRPLRTSQLNSRVLVTGTAADGPPPAPPPRVIDGAGSQTKGLTCSRLLTTIWCLTRDSR